MDIIIVDAQSSAWFYVCKMGETLLHTRNNIVHTAGAIIASAEVVKCKMNIYVVTLLC